MSAAVTELVVSGMVKRFDSRRRVLDGVELTARAGALSLVIGAPGSGKSALVRCLTGVYRPQEGAVSYRLAGSDPVDLTDADARTVAWMRAHHVASFDELLAAAPRLPVSVATARAAGCSRETAVAALTRFHARGLATVPIGRLRAGERLMVALIAALSADRPFVVLDAPERFVASEALTAWLRRLTDGGAVVIATASEGTALESTAAAVGRLVKGRIEWDRT